MADTIKFQCDLANSDNSIPLGFEVLLDGQSMFKTDHVKEPCTVIFDITDDELSHTLQFVMTGKTQEHTIVDDQGNITVDALLSITNIMIDEILLGQLLQSKLEYRHDFNGTQGQTVAKFYGTMGCNGTVTFEFTTPFYLWLLENM